MAQSSNKPNIVVIWGDDIGIANLSCYTRGLMGYRTPNIDRIANEGMRFTDYYGEQSCTAGRASFLTGQHGLRTGLDQGRFPGRHGRLEQRRPDDRRVAQAIGLCDRAVRQEPSRRPQRIPADGARLRRILRQSLPPECRGGAGIAGLPEPARFSAISRAVRPARRHGLQGERHRRRDGRRRVLAGSASRRSATPAP